MNLGDAIDCPWPLDAKIRGWVPRGGGSKSPNGAGYKETQAVLGGNIKNVV